MTSIKGGDTKSPGDSGDVVDALKCVSDGAVAAATALCALNKAAPAVLAGATAVVGYLGAAAVQFFRSRR